MSQKYFGKVNLYFYAECKRCQLLHKVNVISQQIRKYHISNQQSKWHLAVKYHLAGLNFLAWSHWRASADDWLGKVECFAHLMHLRTRERPSLSKCKSASRCWVLSAVTGDTVFVRLLCGQWGNGVAQLVEHRLEIQRPQVRTLPGAQEKFECFQVKMLCWLVVDVPNPHVYTHA